MKILLSFLLIIPLFLAQRGYSQTPNFKEWFSQKKTQKEYLLKQIAALEAYINLGKKGYTIYKSGLNSISQFTNVEFILHDDYFNSLKFINPLVSKYPRVQDIVTTEHKLLRLHQAIKEMVRTDQFLKASQKQSLLNMLSKMDKEAEELLSDLTTTLSPGILELKDDERIKRIDHIYDQVLRLYQNAQQFSADLTNIRRGKKADQLDIQTMQNIYKP